MTGTELRRRDGGAHPTERSRRSVLWRVKLRLQFTGWLQYLITTNAAVAFLVISAVGWLIGAWQLLLFWLPFGIGALLLAAAIFDIITVKWGVRPRESLPHRQDDVGTFDLIRSRRSCRSFQSRDLTVADRAELMRAVAECSRRDRLIGTSPIRLEYVAAPLTVWPTVGAHEFLVALAPRSYDRLAIIDVGRSLQKVVLHATRMGVATCWIGPGADQTSVVRHLGDRFDPDQDHVVCVCAVGYRSLFEPLSIRMMERVQHRRLPLESLFFADPHFQRPLAVDVPPYSSFGRCYEICQWSPSSFNSQTTRCAAVTERVGTEPKVVRFDFCANTNSRFYAPVALGIWCANWETGCDALGIPGHLAVLSAKDRDVRDTPELPRYDVSWVADPQRHYAQGIAAGGNNATLSRFGRYGARPCQPTTGDGAGPLCTSIAPSVRIMTRWTACPRTRTRRRGAQMTAPRESAVLVLAAGAGTRMRSDTPKVLHTIAGRSMLAHSLRAMAKVAPQHLVVVLGQNRERIAPVVADLADTLGRPIDVAIQDQQLGTGHAVLCGLSALPEDFGGIVVVTSGDIPLLDAETLADLIAVHSSTPAAVTVLTTTLTDPTGYGRILRTQDHQVIAIVEQADATPSQREIREVNAGVYAFDIAPLRSALHRLSADNAQHELYLTDVVAIVRQDGQTVHARHVDDSALVAGVNNRVQLAELAAELNRRIVAAHQLAGVTVVDPATTWIDADVTIGRDTVVAPGTQLRGATRIGGRCTIGPDTTLTDVAVGDDASVIRTHATAASIGDGAAVGPFAYLRPGTVLGADGKLGAFVETKNASIGTGTKVPHLTYVGDADIGEHSNIGASSVFVNYDGTSKQRTTIGSHVRTGSDTMFVAPVTVGDGAYTGAGTVVRSDVPPGALAVSAGPQRNIEDWVQRKRPGSAAAQAAEKAAEKDDDVTAPDRSDPAR